MIRWGVSMIRPASDDDAGTIARWLSDGETTRYLTSNLRGGALSAQVVRLALKRRDQVWYVFSETLESAAPPIGLVALDGIDAIDGIANLWFVLGEREFGGRGHTARAIDALCATNPMQLDVVSAWVAEPNVASLRCLARAGFAQAGRIEGAVALPEGRAARILFARRLARNGR